MSIIRDVTLKAQKYLAEPEILLFIGARQSGKTTILKQIQSYLETKKQTTHFLNLEGPDYLKLLNESPKNLLKIFPFDFKTKAYVFIDEVQYLDNPSNFLKYFYDEYGGRIKLLVSDSSAFYLDKKFKDSLAGRKKIFNVRTVSFREFLRFKNEEELSKKNFRTLTISEKEKILFYYQEYIIYGGYPRVVLSPLEEKRDILQEIAYSYIKKDIYEAHIRQVEVFYKLFKILAGGVGNLVNSSELASALNVSKTAIDNYLYVMQKSFHICLVKPFFRNVRKELTKMPKVYFYDLGLRNFFMNNFNTYREREDRGALLENVVFRQLIEAHDEDEIRFWRTIAHNEVDFIVNGRQALEVKVNPEQFKASKYKLFLENYPNIKLEIVSFDARVREIETHKIVEAWQIEK